MSKIGSFGKGIVFSTSDKKILTFSGFKQEVTGEWAVHDRIRKKSQSEFLGAGLRTVSFNIVLSVNHGVKPSKTMKAIRKIVETGKVEKLVIGGKKVGGHKWKIKSVSEAWDIILSKGEVAQSTLSLSLEEYL